MSDDIHIRCSGCNCYLGVIRDAKLKKGMAYLCYVCENKRVASELMRKNEKYDLPEGFDEIFGGLR